MCEGLGWCELCAAGVICYWGCQAWEGVSKKLGQLAWRRAHGRRGRRKIYVKDGRGCTLGLGTGRAQQAGVELLSLSKDRIRP